MGNQVLHVDDAALDESDGSRPGVGIAVLELKVDLLGAETHEGDLHVGLADTDDEDFAAEFDRIDLPRRISIRSKYSASTTWGTLKGSGRFYGEPPARTGCLERIGAYHLPLQRSRIRHLNTQELSPMGHLQAR